MGVNFVLPGPVMEQFVKYVQLATQKEKRPLKPRKVKNYKS
tara:strand:- start:470 stop:592 length:123 start_codon:yes stop_codon:yes gene_type:complete